jgi:hypothetical protein
MRDARILSRFLVVVFFFTAVLAPERASSAILQAALDPNGRFKISFPVEWQVVKTKNGSSAVIGFRPAPPGQFRANVNVVVEEIPESISAATYAQLAKPKMDAVFNDFTVLQEGPATIARRHAYYRYYTWRPKNQGELYQVQAYFTVARMAYVVTGTTMNDPDRVRRDMPLMRQIFETFTPRLN